MKIKLFLLLIAISLIGCSGSNEISVDKLLKEGSLEQLNARKQSNFNKIGQLEDENARLETAIVKLSPAKNYKTVTSYVVEPVEFNHYLTFLGTVNSHSNVLVFPEIPAILNKILVKEGQRVKKGQPLALLSSSGLEHKLEQLNIQLELAKVTYEKQKSLWEQKIGSEIQFLQAKTNYFSFKQSIEEFKQQLQKTKVLAPFSGVVDDIQAEVGSNLAPGQTPLMRVINLNKMYVETEVPENHISSITKNTPVTVLVQGKEMEGKITQVGNYINPGNRSFKVEIALENKQNILKINMSAEVSFNYYQNLEAITIHNEDVLENAQGIPYTYKLVPSNKKKSLFKTEKVLLKLGNANQTEVEILNGIERGDVIVDEGLRQVQNGQVVKKIEAN